MLFRSIKGAEGQELILEAANEVGNWYGIDTVTVADDGSYRFSREPEGQPEIFRLRLGKETAYFPVDSIETVTLDASVPGMTANYTLAGSDEAHVRTFLEVDGGDFSCGLEGQIDLFVGDQAAADVYAVRQRLLFHYDDSHIEGLFLVSLLVGGLFQFAVFAGDERTDAQGREADGYRTDDAPFRIFVHC